jgi:hydrogenase maturation protease
VPEGGAGPVVVGVGNPYRGDDGIGPAVLDRLERAGLGAGGAAGVTLVPSDGEPTRLIEAWEGAAVAVVVDAVRTGAAPVGTVHRWELVTHPGSTGPSGSPGVSGSPAVLDTSCARGGSPDGWPGDPGAGGGTHALGLADALELASALGRLPTRLVVYGVEGVAFGLGDAMSPAVAAAADRVAAAIADELADELAARVPTGWDRPGRPAEPLG